MSIVRLHGYKYSVYNRIARLTLLLKEVEHEVVEVDPFSEPSEAYLALHPFGRVPTLTHDGFALFETNAITRYIDRAFQGRPLQPERAAIVGRMDQVISVIDAYGYWPMVRQVSSHGFFRNYFGEASDPEEVAAGLQKSRTVLSFLNGIAEKGEILNGRTLTLADCHLAPMLDYFVRADAGREALSHYRAIQGWWDKVSHLDVLASTDPMPNGGGPSAAFDKN